MDIINLDNGKYILYVDGDNGILKADRYREPWRDCTGDNLVYFLALEVLKLKEELKNANTEG